MLCGSQATNQELVRQIQWSWVAHLACHGHNGVAEFESMRLLLSDGDFTLEDVRALPALRSRLVFLSARQTGQPDLRRVPDEMVGLPIALVSAGAAAVVSTLWPIDDRVTAMLVGRLYGKLAAMLTRGEPDDVPVAMNRAQRWLRGRVSDRSARTGPSAWDGLAVCPRGDA